MHLLIWKYVIKDTQHTCPIVKSKTFCIIAFVMNKFHTQIKRVNQQCFDDDKNML